MLIAKHDKPLTGGMYIKDFVMKNVENIFLEKRREFTNVFLTCNTVAQRVEDILSDIQRYLRDRGVTAD